MDRCSAGTTGKDALFPGQPPSDDKRLSIVELDDVVNVLELHIIAHDILTYAFDQVRVGVGHLAVFVVVVVH